jgi:hypothetical protein
MHMLVSGFELMWRPVETHSDKVFFDFGQIEVQRCGFKQNSTRPQRFE